jgi:hypothetical protein
MFARRVDITAGTPGHRYLVERQWKCLEKDTNNTRFRVLVIEESIGLPGKPSGFVIFSMHDSRESSRSGALRCFTAGDRESLGP